jgi:hypothetical protein
VSAAAEILLALSVVESRPLTTLPGGVTGAGFRPGVSGNPGVRPKGLGRRVRELVGEDGSAIAEFMLAVMRDERARTRDRLEAGRWLADRAFGRSVQPLDVDVGVRPSAVDATKLSDEELKTYIAIYEKACSAHT